MRYFLDQEFIDNGRTIELISIGIVAEDGREFYEISKDFEDWQCDDWLKQHVLPNLGTQSRREKWEIRFAIEAFLLKDEKPEFWAYFADYDWVCFCQLWGRMIDLPAKFPKFCLDIKQLAVEKGVKKLKDNIQLLGTEHNALADARWNKVAYEWLRKLP